MKREEDFLSNKENEIVENGEKKVVLGEENFKRDNQFLEEDLKDRARLENEYERDIDKQDEDYVKTSSDFVKNDKKKRNDRRKNRVISAVVLLLLAALLSYFANSIQEMIFASTSSILFEAQKGLFGPRAGVIYIFLGLFLIISVIFAMLARKDDERTVKSASNKEAKRKPLKTIGLILGLILTVLGFTTWFNFTDYREENIVQNSVINRNKISPYTDILKQTVTMNNASTREIKYTLDLKNGSSVTLPFNEKNKNKVRTLDSKIGNVNVLIDNDTYNEVINKKLYTASEAALVYGR